MRTRGSLMVLAALVSVSAAQNLSTARMLEAAGQLARAFEEYGRVLSRNPRDMAAYDGFRRTGRETGEFDSLLAMSNRLAAGDSGQVQFQVGRLDGLFGLGRKREALAACRVARDRFPHEAIRLVEVLEYWQEYGEAVAYLREFRKAVPDPAAYADRLVVLCEKAGNYLDAAREMVPILNRDPGLLAGYQDRIRDYAARVNGGRLLAVLEDVADDRTRARAQAEVRLASGQDKEAVDLVRRVMSRDGLYGFAREVEEDGALGAALIVFREQGLLADQARVLRKMGKTREALDALAKDRSPEARFELAEVQRLELKDYTGAAASYSDVLKRRPQYEPAAYGLALALLMSNRLEQAADEIEKLERQTERTLLLQAQLCFYQGEFDSVQSRVDELVRLDPQSPLLNDALELSLLAHGGQGSQELAAAMLELRTGNPVGAADRARRLMSGNGAAAEVSYFVVAGALRQQGEAKAALELLDGFVLRFENSPRLARARLEQARILREDLQDENEYRETLERLMVDYPGSPYAPVARVMLAEANRPVDPSDIR